MEKKGGRTQSADSLLNELQGASMHLAERADSQKITSVYLESHFLIYTSTYTWKNSHFFRLRYEIQVNCAIMVLCKLI